MPAIYTCDECGKPADEAGYDGEILCEFHRLIYKLDLAKRVYYGKLKWLEETHQKQLANLKAEMESLTDQIKNHPDRKD